jgi:hypothetical protein
MNYSSWTPVRRAKAIKRLLPRLVGKPVIVISKPFYRGTLSGSGNYFGRIREVTATHLVIDHINPYRPLSNTISPSIMSLRIPFNLSKQDPKTFDAREVKAIIDITGKLRYYND